MTISSVVFQAGPFAGNGVTTSFPFTFKVFTASEMLWTKRDVSGNEFILVKDLDYNVTLNADQNASPGGTISFPLGGSVYAVLAVNESLVGLSNAPATQLINLVAAGGFFPEVIAQGLDRMVMLVQQLTSTLNRTLKYSVTDASSPSLPTSLQRANQYLAFDGSGNPIAASSVNAGVAVSIYMQTVVSSVNQAVARAALGIETLTAVASQASPDIWTATGMSINYTGAVGTTGFAAAPQAGARRRIICASNPVFTAGANMLIDGLAAGATYQALAGDQIDVIAVTTTQFRLITPNRPFVDTYPFVIGSVDGTKKLREEVDGLTTATTRKRTPGDFNHPTGAGHEISQGRLTFTTGVPVTVADVTGAGANTLFYTPYKGDLIGLSDGTDWAVYRFTERSIAVPATTLQMYDVFVFNNAGTLTLELLAWTNDTTRATTLTMLNGVLVKTGDATRRYVGSFRTALVVGQSEDSAVKRYLWNNANRVTRPLLRREGTASWNYTIATLRQANASAANQVDFVRGLDEDAVEVQLDMGASNAAGAAGMTLVSTLGLDSTTAITAGVQGGSTQVNLLGAVIPMHAAYCGFPGIGRHFISWNESSQALGTTTFFGQLTGAGVTVFSGMTGFVTA